MLVKNKIDSFIVKFKMIIFIKMICFLKNIYYEKDWGFKNRC